MEQIKEWAFTICMAGLAGTISNMILPKGNMEKVFRIVVQVFFLSAIVSPILFEADWSGINLEFSSSLSSEYAGQLQQKADQAVIQRFQTALQDLVRQELSAMNVESISISVQISTVTEKELKIDRIIVVLKDGEQMKETEIRMRIRNLADSPIDFLYKKSEQ